MTSALTYLDATFQSGLVQIWFHGVYTVVMLASTIGFLSKNRRRDQKHWRLLAGVTAAMYLLSTIYAAVAWDLRRKIFVFNSLSSRIVPFGEAIAGALAFSTNILIADCLFIWRCWIIWGCNLKIVIPAALLTLAGTVFSILANYAQIHSTLHNSSTQESTLFVDSGTIYLSLSFITTSIITLLISGRIFWIHYQTKSILGDNYQAHASRGSYLNTIEIIVESAAPYAVSELVLLILLVRGDISYLYAQGIVGQVTGLAPTLMLARISLGYARPSTAWMPSKPEMRLPADFHFVSEKPTAASNLGDNSDNSSEVTLPDLAGP